MKRVAVITVNYNGLNDTVDLLNSLRKSEKPNNLIIQTIVVDNASQDDSVAVIRKKFPEVDIISSHKNLGFAGGNNLGIKKAIKDNADWLILINNDCLVEEKFFKNLEKSSINNSHVGVLGGLVYFAPGFEFLINIHQKTQARSFGMLVESLTGQIF
jgi:GT2 family glycosyltransferase